MADILLIALILIIIWYWWDTQQSNEIALTMCKRKCSQAGLQLLDATVSRQRSWIRRGPRGNLQICRLYSFDYYNEASETFSEAGFGGRNNAYIVLIGNQVVETSMPHHDSPIKKVN